MNILHCIASLDKNTGGPARSVTHLASELASHLTGVNVFAIESQNPIEFDPTKFEVTYTPTQKSFASLKNLITNNKFDLIHSHGIWLKVNHFSNKLARENNIPYIISPRGMLEPWSMTQGKIKKKLALTLFQKNDLQKAACIHATAQMEAENLKKLGLTAPIAVIPNGINLKEFPFPFVKSQKKHKTILFFSRIHHKKGIEILIEAWSLIKEEIKQGWKIEIAGNGEPEYISKLNKQIQTLKLQNTITIIGPQFGVDKLNTYQRADLFVLPTYSENFGIVVAEALACGVPVITTNGTPWQDLNTSKSGWCIDLSVDKLSQTIEEALYLSDQDRSIMGQKGRKLIEENYSIESVASKMKQLYAWVLNKTNKPNFVYLD